MGDFLAHASATFNAETSTLILSGTGSLGIGGSALYNVVVADSATITATQALDADTLSIYGSLTVDVSATVITALNLYGTATGAGYIEGTDITITSDGGIVTCTLNAYGDTTLSGYINGDLNVLATAGDAANVTLSADGGCVTLALESAGTDVTITATGFAFSVGDDITSNTTGGTPTYSLVGLFEAVGSLAQDWDLSALDISGFTWTADKSGGSLTFTSVWDAPLGRDATLQSLITNATITLNGFVLDSESLEVTASGEVSGTGTVVVHDGNLTVDGTFEPSHMVYEDWDAVLIPTTVAADITLRSSGDAVSSVTPVLDGTYDWGDLTLECEGSADLIVDCSVNDPVLQIGGDVDVVELGSGHVQWIAGTQDIVFDGSGDQTIAFGLTWANFILNPISVTNSGGTVTFTEDLWTTAYDAGGASVSGEEHIHIAGESDDITGTHYAIIRVFNVDMVGNVYDPLTTSPKNMIGSMSMQHRVDVSGFPTIKSYLESEAADDYVIHTMNEYMIITTKQL